MARTRKPKAAAPEEPAVEPEPVEEPAPEPAPEPGPDPEPDVPAAEPAEVVTVAVLEQRVEHLAQLFRRALGVPVDWPE